MEDYYKILNVNERATQEEIKKSYRKLSLLHHPDKNGGKDTMFKKINEAYEHLSDIDKRKEYDNKFIDKQLNMEDIFNDVFGNNNNEDLFNIIGGPLAHMFSINGLMPNNRANIRIFHNGINISPTTSHFIEKPEPIIYNLNINIENILEDHIVNIDIDKWIIKNNIKTIEKEKLYVNIPKGIDNNEYIILNDRGNNFNDIIKGDIKIVVNIINNTDFKRDGLDLIYYKDITLKDSLCGFSFEIKHLNNKIYTLNNTSGNIITPNYKKIIPELGLCRDTYKGNLILIFNIIYPVSLDIDKIEKLKEIL